MPLGLLLILLKYALLVALLAFVALVLQQMMHALPRVYTPEESEGAARRAAGARTIREGGAPQPRRRPAIAAEGQGRPRPGSRPVGEVCSGEGVSARAPASEAGPEPAVQAQAGTGPTWPEDEEDGLARAEAPVEEVQGTEAEAPAPQEEAVVSGALLRVTDPGASQLALGAEFPVDSGAHIGRAASNDVVVPDTHVSRQHAYLGRRGANWVLVDKGSVNGTAVNGQRVTGPVLLGHGDVISLGSVRFVFVCPGGGGSG